MNYSKSWSFKKLLGIFLWAFLVSSVFLLASCDKEPVLEKKEDIEFPVDDKGYPKNNVVMINNKAYPIDLVGESHMGSEIEVKMDQDRDIVEIVLPQRLPINYWSLDEKEYMDLISYSMVDFPIKDEDMVEGPSAAVQKFGISVPRDERTEILLKWSNVDEIGKLFKDKKEDYLLKIIVTY
ncbi:hypothetical protein [uncultured Anaerococcus sp.]|uniref:hypothetical protein n=1 Tax=uncultured Anaerococcus sp. TaxID=293428 RepID=UPI00288A3F7C|nr:hypothetical protein [uncultured Anaerococcus sp.]